MLEHHLYFTVTKKKYMYCILLLIAINAGPGAYEDEYCSSMVVEMMKKM